MRRRDAGSCGTYIERFRELNELHARSIDASKEHGHLKANARRPTALNWIQALTFFINLEFQASPDWYPRTSTILHIRCQVTELRGGYKPRITKDLAPTPISACKKSIRNSCSAATDFLKCANGTLFPLTEWACLWEYGDAVQRENFFPHSRVGGFNYK